MNEIEMDGGKGEVLNDITQRGRNDALWRKPPSAPYRGGEESIPDNEIRGHHGLYFHRSLLIVMRSIDYMSHP